MRENGVINFNLDSISFKNGKESLLREISCAPSITIFGVIFEILSELKWNEYSVEHKENYKNVFGRICAELRSKEKFGLLSLVNQMKEVLGDRFSILFQAMRDYSEVFHGKSSKEIRKIQDVISSFSALYVSKSKESYKKKQMQFYLDSIKDYFKLKIDHPLVQKKVILPRKKRKFEQLYRSLDPSVLEFLKKLVQRYSEVDSVIIWKLIDGFVLNHHHDLEQVITPPTYYSEYERYQKAVKFIHRLNQGYIRYDSAEMRPYQDIVQYDSLCGQYVYKGIRFGKEMEQYQVLKRVFQNIKKEILFYVKTISVDEWLDFSLFQNEFPFTDEYFEFDFETSAKRFADSDLVDFFQYSVSGMEWLLWYFLFLPDHRDTLIHYMNHADDFCGFSCMSFSDFFKLMIMLPNVDQKSIAILGSDLVLRLCDSSEYTNQKSVDVVSMATELMVEMSKRNCSTVPYVSGETKYYRYSMYDFNDETVLLSGIDTDSCFKVGGYDHDFMSYCCIDKNGFVLKFMDHFGKFIGKASGFRNGNSLFINQLKTIYDDLGNGYFGEYEQDLVEVFKMACEDIVSSSSIDFVFVTQSYVLSDYPSNVSKEVTEKIGDKPMDRESSDWSYFISHCPNLMEHYGYFTTDYGSYDLICMASSKSRCEVDDLQFFDVEPIYKRVRNPVVISDFVDEGVLKKVNRILGLHAYLNDTEVQRLCIPSGASVMMGDHWFIIYQEDILYSCVLEFDEEAKKEFDFAKERLHRGLKILEKS